MSRFEFKLPDVGEGAAEAEIVEWRVAVGDVVEEDQPLVDVMTDKANVEMTSPVAGKVLAIQGTPGDMAAVGSIIAVIETDADAPAQEPPAAATDKAYEQQLPAKGEPAPVAPKPAPAKGGKVIAPPAVRKRAESLGIELSTLSGSGPDGRIEHADLDARLAEGRPTARTKAFERVPGSEVIKVIGLRRKIAEQMAESARRIPHFTYVEAVDTTELEALRQRLNARRGEGLPKLSVLPFLIRAVVLTVPDFPQVNARFDDEAGEIHRYKAVHLGMATQTDNGLVVPVIKDAQDRSMNSLAEEIARLAAVTRAGTTAREELSGSTITITSLGVLGGVAATPVINHPEVGILCPNRITETPVIRNGQLVFRKMMNLSSSFDHRVVDGHDAASFIQALKGRLEDPLGLLLA